MPPKQVKKKRRPKQKRSTKLLTALKKLSKLPLAERRRQLQLANSKFVKDLCAATRKTRTAKLSPALRKKLKPHRRSLRTLVDRRTSIGKKKRLLVQRGGIAPLLVPIIVAAIGATGTVGAAATHAAISRA